MKHKWFTILVLAGLMLVSTPLAASAYQPGLRSIANPFTSVRIATPEPASIDPALAAGDALIIVNQLFSGLTRINPTTNAPIPDLASSWSVSADKKQYTFTLRSGLQWSNGDPLTASDVRYGILRSLDPDTGSGLAYVLFVIKNAAGFNDGSITNPNLVGVSVLSSTKIQFTLNEPASYFPAILAMAVARPQPAAAIAAWGADWTEASHIVTSGPYKLTEWVHNNRMQFDKFASFYDAANVQIERVYVKLTDAETAWNLFKAGSLDTTTVPESEIAAARVDPTLSPLLHTNPRGCTYHYGFSISQAPFDKLLVRKAFIAATDRQGLVDTIYGGERAIAQTFTPPGTFGSVDGVTEGVGIPYDPTQAQAWLSAAGYPNGAGLPAITLWYNESTGHQDIAEYIQDSWQTNLNVSVTLNSLPWETYITQLNTGSMQIWRLGWCQDYSDAYNFLHDAVIPNPGRYGGWSNATYEGYLDGAALSNDNPTRLLKYKKAEEILVETDAVMLPLYYYSAVVSTRPYLQRPYPQPENTHIRDWETKFRTQTFYSTGSEDGWVLESAENSNVGGSMNATDTTLRLGDDAARKQYRSILSFNTSSLPDNAVIGKVTLRVKKQGITGGGNPISMFQGLYVGIRKGMFGTAPLQLADFQAKASMSYGPFNPLVSGGWYSLNLTSGKAYINKLATNGGLTQMRLYFKLDDNNNGVANYLSLYSGNAGSTSQPQLIIEYTLP